MPALSGPGEESLSIFMMAALTESLSTGEAGGRSRSLMMIPGAVGEGWRDRSLAWTAGAVGSSEDWCARALAALPYKALSARRRARLTRRFCSAPSARACLRPSSAVSRPRRS